MSQKKYCPACGKPNDYINGVAPITCKSCHKAFAAAFKVEVTAPKITKSFTKKPTKKVIAQEIEDEEDEDAEFYGEIIVPRKFEVEINVPKRMTIGGLAEGGQVPGISTELGSSSFE